MLVSQCMLLSAVSLSLSGRESLHAEVWRDGFELQHLPKDTGGGHGRVKSGRLDKCFSKGICIYIYIYTVEKNNDLATTQRFQPGDIP